MEKSKISSRTRIINYLAENNLYNNGNYLEIGALDKPWLKQYILGNHNYLDYTNKNDLQNKYKNDKSVNIENIVYNKYILKTDKTYSEYIDEKFNIVFSSHNIEHQPNFIQHLNEVYDILEDDGLFIFLCPDYRYIFDFYRNPSTIIDMILAYIKKDTIPNFYSYYEHLLLVNGSNTNNMDNFKLYNKLTVDEKNNLTIDLFYKNFNTINSFEEILTKYSDKEYNDCHVWKITANILNKILNELKRLNLIKFNIELIHETDIIENCYEFGVILKK